MSNAAIALKSLKTIQFISKEVVAFIIPFFAMPVMAKKSVWGWGLMGTGEATEESPQNE